MTRTALAYADCFSGISGDMFLGALLHAGLEEALLRAELAKLQLDPYTLEIEPRSVDSIAGIKVHIKSTSQQQFRNLPAIHQLLDNSGLAPEIIRTIRQVFAEIGQAEATVHNIPVEEVHFHEVGALDTIIDVAGVVIGLHHLGIQKLVSSPIPLGHGFVHCRHGTMPLPAPAVCHILKDVPVYGVNIDKELVTPTGAALIKVLANDFCPLPPMTIRTTGYGLGSHTHMGTSPNLFRLITGYATTVQESQEVEIIETNLDDWSPEGFPYLSEQLFTSGALDVSIAPIQMKKGRPGYRLQVICTPAHSLPLKELILSETTAIGIRHRREHRYTLPREAVTVTTRWGRMLAKKVLTPAGTVIYPEYEECRVIAQQHNVPLREVYQEISRITKDTKTP